MAALYYVALGCLRGLQSWTIETVEGRQSLMEKRQYRVQRF